MITAQWLLSPKERFYGQMYFDGTIEHLSGKCDMLDLMARPECWFYSIETDNYCKDTIRCDRYLPQVTNSTILINEVRFGHNKAALNGHWNWLCYHHMKHGHSQTYFGRPKPNYSLI